MLGIQWSEKSKRANGGTELVARELEKRLPADLLSKFQIFLSYVETPLEEDKIRIFWAHNLPGKFEKDPLKNEGWARFHKLVFVSDWQMQAYINYYNIPWSRCQVLQNAIVPIAPHQKPDLSTIRLIFTPTPFRGLTLLYHVFNRLCEKYDNIELSVFSSFKLYGEREKDIPYEKLFEELKKHPKIFYYGTVENSVLRTYLQQSHIFAYPATIKETSCLCLIEAMSAGLLCVHPRYGALSETAANWTLTYQWQEDPLQHFKVFYAQLDQAIYLLKNNYDLMQAKLEEQTKYMSNFYNWDARIAEWKNFLYGLLNKS